MSTRRLAVLVGGGPAPGINAVISAATIEAINRGFEVRGFYDGFKWLCSDRFDSAIHSVILDIPRVARIHFDGGSILRTARTNLLDDAALKSSKRVVPNPTKISLVLSRLRELGIDCLLTIGGDDTALSARFLSEASGRQLAVVHVPKTIDNDLPLPASVVTFGFSTARLVGTDLVKNLMRDSQTTSRWYFVTCMGRSAGWLAQSIGQAAGATVTLIPEEFGGNSTTVQALADILEGAILKRQALGRPDGVALLAEGLAYSLGDRAELERLLGREVPVDAAGHPRLSEFPLGEFLKRELVTRFKNRGESITIVTHTIGYELRSADPTPYDMAYCRALGFHSVRLFASNGTEDGVLVAMANGNLLSISLSDVIDPETNRIKVRLVDTNSDEYLVGRAYMIRLEKSDFENPDMLRKLAAAAHMTPEQFRQRYESTVLPRPEGRLMKA